MLLSKLIRELESVKKDHGDVPVLYPIHDRDEHRFLSVEDVGMVTCISDSQGMQRALSEGQSVPCVVVFN